MLGSLAKIYFTARYLRLTRTYEVMLFFLRRPGWFEMEFVARVEFERLSMLGKVALDWKVNWHRYGMIIEQRQSLSQKNPIYKAFNVASRPLSFTAAAGFSPQDAPLHVT